MAAQCKKVKMNLKSVFAIRPVAKLNRAELRYLRWAVQSVGTLNWSMSAGRQQLLHLLKLHGGSVTLLKTWQAQAPAEEGANDVDEKEEHKANQKPVIAGTGIVGCQRRIRSLTQPQLI